MPNLYSPDSRDYSKYDAMTTQELERILERYFLFPEDFKDKDLMVHIMEVLTERDIEVIDANISNPNASWDDFIKAHPGIVDTSLKSIDITTVPDRKKAISRKALRRAAGIAAVLVCVLLGGTVTAYAAGIDVFHAIAHWTDDTFCFRPAITESKEVQIPEQLQPLYEALKAFDAVPLIPTYLPEGYNFERVDLLPDPAHQEICCQLQGENSFIIIDYIIHKTTTTYIQYEKNNGDPEIVEVGERTIYLFSNTDNYTATWLDGNIECSIISNSELDLQTIVKSLQ